MSPNGTGIIGGYRNTNACTYKNGDSVYANADTKIGVFVNCQFLVKLA